MAFRGEPLPSVLCCLPRFPISGDSLSYIEIENKIETLVKAKGVANCLAVISEDGSRVDVIIDSEELTDELSLQIKDIATSQLDCGFENVTIIQSVS